MPSKDKITFAKSLDDQIAELDRTCKDVLNMIAQQDGYRTSTAVRHADLVALEVATADLRGAISRHAA